MSCYGGNHIRSLCIGSQIGGSITKRLAGSSMVVSAMVGDTASWDGSSSTALAASGTSPMRPAAASQLLLLCVKSYKLIRQHPEASAMAGTDAIMHCSCRC